MPESAYYGACLAALAIGGAAPEYRDRPEVEGLAAYLQREQAAQPLHNRLMLLWAASKLPPVARPDLLDEVWRKQEKDGGWTIQSLGPWKLQPERLRRALAWLRSHQDPLTGAWPAPSMNKRYEPGSMPLLFMRDAATSFAVLALLDAGN